MWRELVSVDEPRDLEQLALAVSCLTCGAARTRACQRYLPRRPLEHPHPSRMARALRVAAL